MNIQWHISNTEGARFMQTCEAIIRNVDGGTKAATTEACIDILNMSMAQVPVDTGALISSADYVVERRSDVKGYRYEGVVGYAGFNTIGLRQGTVRGTSTVRDVKTMRDPATGRNVDTYGTNHGKTYSTAKRINKNNELIYTNIGARLNGKNPINPKTGLPVSAYAGVVHEDLSMPHPRGGKAKFLEDPVREYGQAKFARVAETHWRWAIEFVQRDGYNKYGRKTTFTVPSYGLVKLTGAQSAPHSTGGKTIL